MTPLVTCRKFWLKLDLCVLSPLVTLSLRKSLTYTLASGTDTAVVSTTSSFFSSVVLIPIAMPTMLSVTLAVGAPQLAKYKAIVARITAIEEFAGVTIPCSEL